MKNATLSTLRWVSLAFLLPGLVGLMLATAVSTDYLRTLPRQPDPPTSRMFPRNIHGVMIYQTASEDEKLSIIEYTSTTIFFIGLATGLVYLRKWSIARSIEAEDDDVLAEEN